MKTRSRTAIGALLAAVGTALVMATPSAWAVEVPEHAIIVCQSATWYTNYDHATGPYPPGGVYTLFYGNKVGHTRGAHPVYNGWAATYDFGGPLDNDWGYVRYECLGGWGSW